MTETEINNGNDFYFDDELLPCEPNPNEEEFNTFDLGNITFPDSIAAYYPTPHMTPHLYNAGYPMYPNQQSNSSYVPNPVAQHNIQHITSSIFQNTFHSPIKNNSIYNKEFSQNEITKAFAENASSSSSSLYATTTDFYSSNNLAIKSLPRVRNVKIVLPEDRFKCPHPHCKKLYKNSNGLKYHLEKGNCEYVTLENIDVSDSPRPKGKAGKVVNRRFYCLLCQKEYRNLNGLRYHASREHEDVDFDTQIKGILSEKSE